MSWNQISTQADIDNLLSEYSGFHDSCICSVEYVSGAKVNEEGWMGGTVKDCALIMTFNSQMAAFVKEPEKRVLELKFVGLRRLNLIGHQDNYFGEITSCHLSFYDGHIIWADTAYFDPADFAEEQILEEPMTTFVISDRLEWRFA